MSKEFLDIQAISAWNNWRLQPHAELTFKKIILNYIHCKNPFWANVPPLYTHWKQQKLDFLVWDYRSETLAQNWLTNTWYILTSCIYCTSYELFLLHELRVTFYIRVTSYFYCTCYKLLFIARVTSYCLLHELRVTFCIRVTIYWLLQKLRVNL